MTGMDGHYIECATVTTFPHNKQPKVTAFGRFHTWKMQGGN